MRDPLVKAYGHVYPVTPALYAALESALRDALNDDEDVPLLCQEGDMARISMEGSYFPEDEVVEAFRAHLLRIYETTKALLSEGRERAAGTA